MSGPRVLLGVSGSIAAYKAVEVLRLLQKAGASVQVAMTRGAQAFVQPLTFEAISGAPVLAEIFEVGAQGRWEIEHVERAHGIDLALVAPASANTIARLAGGFADDLLSATLLSTRAPVAIAPAMETGMWSHPATQENVARLVARGVHVLGPVAGELASGRSGLGRMLEPAALVPRALALLERGDLAGRRVLITAGPTWESLDPVRILTNRSTGAMGIAIAEAAARRGAEVTLVLGPTHLSPAPHPRLSLVRVETAAEMLQASLAALPGTTLLVATAAVSDYRPSAPRAAKLKRSDPSATRLELSENPDVLATLAAELRQRAEPAVVVGFAAETESPVEHARAKLLRKGCDVVIANEVGPDRGFGPGETRVAAVRAEGEPRWFGPAPKTAVAEFVLDQASSLGGQGER
jgi:phosphopantothenoylcysteine decarboxylase/phosphopantothenate--cysteine ligase